MNPLDYLPAVPASLAMLGSLAYLWAGRRRSPRAVGLATAGLVGGLAVHLGGQAATGPVVGHLIANGGAVGLGPGPAITAFVTALNAVLSGCLLLVVAAVLADRRPPDVGDN